MPPALPTFVVAGAGRSGTTGLVEGLRTHPDVFVTQPKEPHYLALHGTRVDFRGPGDEATINRVAVTDRQAYLDLFDGSGESPSRGDGSVSTLYYHERSLPEVHAINPELRVVLLLRDPVDRAFSSFQYMRARGFEPEEEFLAAVEDEPARRAANWHHLWHYVQMSMYADAVGAFRDALGPEQVGIWFYDDLQADYHRTLSEVVGFIGADPERVPVAEVPRVNISGTPRSQLTHRAIQAATGNESVRRAVKRLTSYRTREFVRRLALRPDGVVPDARRSLEPRFTADLEQLGRILADHPRPLPPWIPRTT